MRLWNSVWLRHFVIVAGIVFLTGCATSVSQLHFGVHHLGDNTMLLGRVSEKVDGMTNQAEEIFVHGLVTYDPVALEAQFSDRLRIQLGDDTLVPLLSRLKLQYEFTGEYTRRVLPRPYSLFVLDEGTIAEPFDYYDLVMAEFRLKGKPDALVRVYTTSIGSVIRIAGFEVFKDGEAQNPPVSYLAPESVDKAKVIGRKYRLVQ